MPKKQLFISRSSFFLLVIKGECYHCRSLCIWCVFGEWGVEWGEVYRDGRRRETDVDLATFSGAVYFSQVANASGRLRLARFVGL